MNSSSTLTSLAMLKVTIDQGGDYLDYLNPFVLHVLSRYRPSPIIDSKIKECIIKEFGLEIPERTIQIVLKRLSKRYPIRKQEGIYRIEGNIPDPNITLKKAEATRHINSVIEGLIEFSQNTGSPISDRDAANKAIINFLAQFDVSCLRAFLRGTTIPEIKAHNKSDLILVSKYAIQLQQTNPDRFKSFMVMVQGHMLANALLAPDLRNTPGFFCEITFYFDTPLLIHLLGLEGLLKQNAAKDLTKLLNRLKANLAIFSHTKEELEKVIIAAANNLDKKGARGAIIREARLNNKTKSDFFLIISQLDEILKDYKIETKPTPPYDYSFQIDEKAFEDILEDEVAYYNPNARLYDINSVRSIYVLRKGLKPSMLEKARAILVTSNSAFARAAWKYGQKFNQSHEVSTVITDFSLANIAWLKVPLGAPSLPMNEVLAYSYAALEPSQQFLDKFINEIEKLERTGKISPRDHQLLRSSPLVQDELMSLTLGQEDALTEESVMETLHRVIEEIKKEEAKKLAAEKESHIKTQTELIELLEKEKRRQERIYWKCEKKANILSWILFYLFIIVLLIGLFGASIVTNNIILKWLFKGAGILTTIFYIINLILGTTLKSFRLKIKRQLLNYFIKKESTFLDLDIQIDNFTHFGDLT